MKVSHILGSKKVNTIFSVTPAISVFDALVLMAEKNISSVLVLENEQLAGIFTERDYARKIILKGKNSSQTTVGEVMTSNLITVNSETKLEECMMIISEKHIRHLPVVDGEKLTGIISINDVVDSIIKDQKQRITSLENYISGSYA